MVNGVSGVNPDDGVEGFARAPFCIASDVRFDGVWASNAPEWTRLVEQRYDFATGELSTRWTFRVEGTTATVESLVFCPRSVPALATCEITVRVDRPADLEVTVGIDPPMYPGAVTPTLNRRTRVRTKESMVGCAGTHPARSPRLVWPTQHHSGAMRTVR